MDPIALICFCVSNILLQEWYLFSRILLGRKKNHFHKIIRILAASVGLKSSSYSLLRTIPILLSFLSQVLDNRCIGPPDQRVLVSTNINPNATQQQLEEGAQGTDYTYTEQIIWRNADTGNILAESDFFPAMSPGILVTPGYGRIIYEMLYNGHSRIIEERYIGPEYNLDEMLIRVFLRAKNP
jgi:hypothetical protein